MLIRSGLSGIEGELVLQAELVSEQLVLSLFLPPRTEAEAAHCFTLRGMFNVSERSGLRLESGTVSAAFLSCLACCVGFRIHYFPNLALELASRALGILEDLGKLFCLCLSLDRTPSPELSLSRHLTPETHGP